MFQLFTEGRKYSQSWKIITLLNDCKINHAATSYWWVLEAEVERTEQEITAKYAVNFNVYLLYF